MSIDKRQELEKLDLFCKNNKEWFLSFVYDISKSNIDIDQATLRYAMDKSYDMLLKNDDDFSFIQELFSKTNGSSESLKFIIIRAFFELLSKYSSQTESDFKILFAAIERIVVNLTSQEIETNLQIQEVKTQSSEFGSTIFHFGEDASDQIKIIVGKLKEFQENSYQVSFLNLYKDVPIKNRGEIVDVSQDEVVFKVDSLQILAMLEENVAYIMQERNLSSHVKADIIGYSLNKNVIKLGNFSRIKNMPASSRVDVRVHPEFTTMVELANKENETAKGILYDISNGGIGVLSSTDLKCKNGDKLKAKFNIEMPGTEKIEEIELNLELVILLCNNGTYRFCMKNTDPTLEIVKQYTKKREEDTIKSLQETISSYK